MTEARDPFETELAQLWENDEPLSLSPALLRRRSKLRRLVGSIVAALTLFTVLTFVGSDPPWRTRKNKARSVEERSHQVERREVAAIAKSAPPRDATPEKVVDQTVPLRLLGVELPDSLPKDVLDQFLNAKQSLDYGDFDTADAILQQLCRAQENSVRDRARLVRALSWVEVGKGARVRSVFEDLSSHSKITSVQARARQYLEESQLPETNPK